jgi:deoxyribodipyrimidine photolyase-related protein
MMVYVFDKMKEDRKKMILSEADKFIKKNTTIN